MRHKWVYSVFFLSPILSPSIRFSQENDKKLSARINSLSTFTCMCVRCFFKGDKRIHSSVIQFNVQKKKRRIVKARQKIESWVIPFGFSSWLSKQLFFFLMYRTCHISSREQSDAWEVPWVFRIRQALIWERGREPYCLYVQYSHTCHTQTHIYTYSACCA